MKIAIKYFINIGLVSALLAMASCRHDNHYAPTVMQAENILEKSPDSAFIMLDGIDSKKSTFDKPFRMHFEMLKASAQNKAYIPFDTDSIAKVFTSYYDKEGNSNQKVMSHYLLGCTYRDMGDSPQTMKCYIDAIERADTTSGNCDYRLLSTVYGQLAVLYLDQELGDEALYAFKQAERYAFLGKDTLMAIMCISHRSFVYEMQNNLSQTISNAEYASSLYKKHGYDEEAASVLGTAIQALVLSGQYHKAKKYINIYEKESGFFDSNGDIAEGKELYYYVKGLYYLGVKSDSAEFFFRKELLTTNDLYEKMSAVYGLHAHYKDNNRDSVLKYAEMLIELKDSFLNAKSTESIRKMSSLYRYNHIQKTAEKEKEKAEWYQLLAIVSVIFFLLIAVICILFVRYLKIKDVNRNKDVEALKSRYNTMQELLKKENVELEEMRDDKILKTKIIKDKEAYISQLNSIISDLKEELSFADCQNRDDIDNQIREKAIFVKFERYAQAGGRPSESDWSLIKNVFDDLFPQFKLFLSRHDSLREEEYRLCILVRLCFSPKVIQSFLGISSSYVSAMRRRLCLKVFNMEGTPKEFDKKIRKIF